MAREYGKKYNYHMVEGNSFGTIKVTADAREELHQQFKYNGGDVYCVLSYNDKHDGYTFQFLPKSPSIRCRVIEVHGHSKPWMLTMSMDIFDKLKFRTLDIRMTIDGCILYPCKYR